MSIVIIVLNILSFTTGYLIGAYIYHKVTGGKCVDK